MAGGSQILYLYASSSRASQIKRLTTYFPMSTRRYSDTHKDSNGHGVEVKAPSAADEFKRVAEEKAHQGFASQTVEKAQDGIAEAIVGDSSFESVKESYKEPPGKGNFHKTGDDDEHGVKSI